MMSLGLLNSLPLARGGSFWFPPQASDFAAGHDFVYDLILWLCVIFFVAICGATIYFVIKYRKRPGHKAEITSTHNTRLEVAWSVIPLLLLMLIFGVSTFWYLKMVTPPTEDVYELEVVAQKWNWQFIYTGGPFGNVPYYCSDLHLIKDQAYQAIMTTPDADVIHSMFIPAFRAKQDCVPGRYNRLWFRPTMLSPEGGFDLFCTEYCGEGHSMMTARVFVYESEDEWIAAVKEDGDILGVEDLVERGKRVYQAFCATCHSVDGRDSIGPTWQGLWGSTRTFTDGTSAVADREYIRESIIQPAAKIVQGYPNSMPPFNWGADTDEFLRGLYAYMQSLANNE
jgi:cytochrome c oxidase subunit II